jgi:hypothetical protein
MANISAADVKKLRELTGAGMMDCKKALTEADGDFDKAVEILRIKGGKKMAERAAEREASAGLVAHSAGVLVELKCESDFVAKGDDFVATAQKIADAASESKAADVEALKAIEIDGQTVGNIVDALAVSIGEKIELGQYVHFDGPVVATCTSVPPTCRPPSASWSSTTATPTLLAPPRCRSPRCARSTSPATRSPPTSSPRSARSPRPPRARRASPSRRSPRSPRAG